MAVSKFTKHVVVRLLIALVLASNLYCAISFIISPASYTAAYQLTGQGASAAIAGIGVAFVMWNIPYIPLLVFPYKYPILYAVVIVQQLVGLAGEIWIYQGLNSAQALLASSIMRFVIFDALGAILLIISLALTRSR